MSQKYKIKVNCNRSLLEKTLERLFKYGYVMGAELRIRTIKDLYKQYGKSNIRTIKDLYKQYGKSNSGEWDWITSGEDDECKMVLGALSHWAWSSELREYKTVDVDEFLFLNEDITQEEFLKIKCEKEEAEKKANEERAKKDEELRLKRMADMEKANINSLTAEVDNMDKKVRYLYSKWKNCGYTTYLDTEAEF